MTGICFDNLTNCKAGASFFREKLTIFGKNSIIINDYKT